MKKVLLILLLIPAVCGSVDLYPSIKIVKGGNCYDDPGGNYDSVDFWAKNVDWWINGNIVYDHNIPGLGTTIGKRTFDLLKQRASFHGRTIENYMYANLHSIYACTDTTLRITAGGYNMDWWTMMKASDSIHGGVQSNREDLYIHYGDDTVNQTLLISGNTNYCSVSGATNRKLDIAGLEAAYGRRGIRFSQGIWQTSANTGGMNMMNVLDPDADEIRAMSFMMQLNDPKTYWGLDSSFDGFFLDNAARMGIFENYWGVPMLTWGGATGGSAWQTGNSYVDFEEGAAPNVNGYTTWWPGFCNVLRAVGDTLTRHGYGVVGNYANYAASRADDYIYEVVGTDTFAVAGILFETRLVDIVIGTWSGIQGDLARMDTCRNHPDVRNVWEYRVLAGEPIDTGYSRSAHTALGAFMAIMDTNSYFCYEATNHTGGIDTKYLSNWDLFKIDIGKPIAEKYSVIDTGHSLAGGHVHLMSREYTDAWVFYLPRETSSGAGSDTSDYYTWDFQEPVSVLGEDWPGHAFDTNYKAGGHVNIKYGHAAFVLKQRSESPPTIMYISPPTGYTDYIDSSVTVSAQCDDDYGIDSIKNYMRRPTFTDSVAIWDTIFADGVTSWTPSNPYTWTMQGQYCNVFKVFDDSDHVSTDSAWYTISTPPVVAAAKTTYKNISPKGLRIGP